MAKLYIHLTHEEFSVLESALRIDLNGLKSTGDFTIIHDDEMVIVFREMNIQNLVELLRYVMLNIQQREKMRRRLMAVGLIES